MVTLQPYSAMVKETALFIHKYHRKPRGEMGEVISAERDDRI